MPLRVNDPVEFCSEIIKTMTEEERSKLFDRVKEFLPGQTEPGLCIDGRGHNYKVLERTNYLFNFLNKTKFFCTKCKDTIWQ